MRTNVPEKLLAIVDDIDAHGSANLTRLTVLKKWFKRPGRLPAFGRWIAKRAAGRKGKTKAAAGALLDEARALLGTTATREGFLLAVEPRAGKLLHDRARDFQNKFQHQPWGPVRIIPTSFDKQTVIARSVATKQSSWIATARFAHLAMTNG